MDRFHKQAVREARNEYAIIDIVFEMLRMPLHIQLPRAENISISDTSLQEITQGVLWLNPLPANKLARTELNLSPAFTSSNSLMICSNSSTVSFITA